MTAEPAPVPAPKPTALAEAIGGVRGIIDSGAPIVVFVVVVAVGTLRAAVLAALGVAVVVSGIRLARREPVRYAISGCLGVGVSAVVALRTGKAEGFFLPGIAVQAVYGLAFLGSIAVRRPLVTVVLRGLGRPVPGRRIALATTALWAGVFLVRAVVQGALYLAGQPGWLAAVRIGMGWPLTFLALAATASAVRPRSTDQAPGARSGIGPDLDQNSVGTGGSRPRSPS